MSDILLITTYQSFEYVNSSQTAVMLRMLTLVYIRYQIKAYILTRI